MSGPLFYPYLPDNYVPPADVTVERIGDLLSHDLPELLSMEVPR